MVTVAPPEVWIVTLCEPVVTPKSPLAVTVTLTASGAAGAGAASRVKVTSWPSSPLVAPLMFTSGLAGGGSSLSATPTVAAPCVVETV